MGEKKRQKFVVCLFDSWRGFVALRRKPGEKAVLFVSLLLLSDSFFYLFLLEVCHNFGSFFSSIRSLVERTRRWEGKRGESNIVNGQAFFCKPSVFLSFVLLRFFCPSLSSHTKIAEDRKTTEIYKRVCACVSTELCMDLKFSVS